MIFFPTRAEQEINRNQIAKDANIGVCVCGGGGYVVGILGRMNPETAGGERNICVPKIYDHLADASDATSFGSAVANVFVGRVQERGQSIVDSGVFAG